MSAALVNPGLPIAVNTTTGENETSTAQIYGENAIGLDGGKSRGLSFGVSVSVRV